MLALPQAYYRGRLARLLATKLRVQKQEEEERRRKLEEEAERREREKEAADQTAIDEALKYVHVSFVSLSLTLCSQPTLKLTESTREILSKAPSAKL